MKIKKITTRIVLPIFYACDNKFAKYTLVSIKSLIEHASPYYIYHIYILSTGIEEKYKKYAESLKKRNIKIKFVDMEESLKAISDKLPVRDYYSKTTYYRLYIAEMFPQYKRALYIDSDTIILKDVAEAFRVPIGKYYVAACKDQPVQQIDTFSEYVEMVLGIKYKNYFNAGVILINCKNFREKKLLDAFLEKLDLYTFVVAQDQDYLNLIFKDHVYFWDDCWNAQVIGQMTCEEKDFGIIHYNMATKPWNYPETRFANYFWDYAKMTPFYEELLSNSTLYTDEQRKLDALTGDNLISMAMSEINNEHNYFRMMNARDGKSEARKAILEKIEQYELEGRFDEDVEDDPPAPVLMPDQIDYLSKSITSTLQTKYAFKFAHWFVKMLIKKKQLIMKEIKGVEKLRNLKLSKTGAVITCNHFSPNDSFAMQLAFEAAGVKRRKMYRVIREGNYTGFSGFYGFLMRHCDTLPLSSNRDTMKKFLKAVDKVLQKGHFLLVYPEQSMWWNYRKPKPLKKGAFKFAAKNGKPVLPVFITMSDSSVLDGDGYYVQEYTVHICDPIYPDPHMSVPANANAMLEKNYQVWKEVYEDTYGIKLEYTTKKEEKVN